MNDVTPVAEPTKHVGGRRKGSGNTRDAILQAAVEMFAERGYAGTTLRSITDRAGVDVAMVSHFFGGKQGLFDEAVVQLGLHTLRRLFESQPEGQSATEFLNAYFLIWEDPATAKTVRALFRAALESDERRMELQTLMTVSLSGEFPLLAPQGAEGVATTTEDPLVSPSRTALRNQLIAAQLVGIGLSRYITQVLPLATVPKDELVAQLAPVLEAYLADG